MASVNLTDVLLAILVIQNAISFIYFARHRARDARWLDIVIAERMWGLVHTPSELLTPEERNKFLSDLEKV